MDKIFAIVRMTIKPGETVPFLDKARLCLEAAEADLTGTGAYEWFLAPGSTECSVIEIYDDPAALAAHGRSVGAAVAALTAHIDTEITLAGGASPELLAQMRKRLGAVAYAGRRVLGRLQAPSAGRRREAAGTRIFAVARFSIQPGREAEFRRLAERCFAGVEANEPGTLGYEWFLNDTGTECLTIDVYEDAAALGAHIRNSGAGMARILEIAQSQVELFGALPPEFQARLNQGLHSRFVGPQFQGIF